MKKEKKTTYTTSQQAQAKAGGRCCVAIARIYKGNSVTSSDAPPRQLTLKAFRSTAGQGLLWRIVKSM